MGTVAWVTLYFFGLLTTAESHSNYTVFRLITDIQRTEDFEHVLFLKNSKTAFSEEYGQNFIKDMSAAVQIPLIIFSETSSFFLRRKFNSRILTIVYIQPGSELIILKRMVENLRQITLSKVLFLLNYPSKDDEVLKIIFDFCWENSVINVLAVFQDFIRTTTIYRYTHIPIFKIEVKKTLEGLPPDGYFPDRTRNLKGHPIRVVYGGSEPKMIFSRKPNGKVVITGYAIHLFEALARKHNATLLAPDYTQLYSSQALIQMVRKGEVEISVAPTYYGFSFDGFTYPYEYVNWCLMLRVEPSIPGYEIFMIVFRWETLLITIVFIVMLSAVLEYTSGRTGRATNLLSFFVNESILRGVLGQSFSELRNAPLKIKFIYLQVCLLGIILPTSYNSYLQTYMTSPPSQAKIRSLDDLLASGIKVYCWTTEYNQLIAVDTRFKYKYHKLFVFEDDFAKYLKFRDTFNTKFAYVVNNVKWIIVQEQQKIFSRPVFRQPEGVCFFRQVPLAFPIKENSIYMNIINHLMLQMQSSGLLEFWQRKSLNELVEAGKLKLQDLTSKQVFVPMKVDDLKLIWMGVAVAFLLAMLCFLGEIGRKHKYTSKWHFRFR